MSFKSKLKVGGKELNILNASYDLHQEVDASGRPSSVTRGGTINLTVESTGDSFFFEWMTNNFERKDGSIQYVKRDTDAKLKEMNFTISAKELSMGGGEHINEWV